jgi:purine-binding chemotaxis protein CheW
MEKVLTFYLCDNLFGIDIKKVKEINRKVEYTPIPGAKSHISGLYNMRGQIVTLFDLAEILGYEPQAGLGRSDCIILKPTASNPDQIGFLINAPGEVIEVNEDLCEPPPSNSDRVAGDLLDKVVKLEDQLLLIIQSEKITTSLM